MQNLKKTHIFSGLLNENNVQTLICEPIVTSWEDNFNVINARLEASVAFLICVVVALRLHHFRL